jgi:hypothetical protein
MNKEKREKANGYQNGEMYTRQYVHILQTQF